MACWAIFEVIRPSCFFNFRTQAYPSSEFITIQFIAGSCWSIFKIINTFDNFDDLLRYDASNYGIYWTIVEPEAFGETYEQITIGLFFYILAEIDHAVEHLFVHFHRIEDIITQAFFLRLFHHWVKGGLLIVAWTISN